MESYEQQYVPVKPPEIRENSTEVLQVEFYVNLGIPRPDLELFQMIYQYLEDRAPAVVLSLRVSYHAETETEPPLIQATLTLGDFIDNG